MALPIHEECDMANATPAIPLVFAILALANFIKLLPL